MCILKIVRVRGVALIFKRFRVVVDIFGLVEGAGVFLFGFRGKLRDGRFATRALSKRKFHKKEYHFTFAITYFKVFKTGLSFLYPAWINTILGYIVD